MAWQSEDDFIKDLTSLSDFTSTEMAKKFLMLYGKEEPIVIDDGGPATFLDTSSGEPNVVSDDYISFLDFCPRYAGRGKVLRSYLKSKLQLKDQIRLARPLGSNDLIIETYFNRFGPKRNKAKAESAAAPTRINPLEFNSNVKPIDWASLYNSNSSPKPVQPPRIKATRNSKLQSNALIDNLLKKMSEKENESSIKNGKENESSIKNEKENESSIKNEKKNDEIKNEKKKDEIKNEKKNDEIKNEKKNDEIKKENGSSTSSSAKLPDKKPPVTKSDTKKNDDMPITFERLRKLKIDKPEQNWIDGTSKSQRMSQSQKKKIEMIIKQESERKRGFVFDERQHLEALNSQKELEKIIEYYTLRMANYPAPRKNRRRRN